jgi:site-specific recombinase XerC
LTALVDADRQQRCPASMPADRRATRVSAFPPIRPVEEIVAVMRTVGDDAYGRRLRALIVVLWRAGLRIREALTLQLSYRGSEEP